MKTIYLVKKDPSLPGNDDNWITMNGYEFAHFMETAEGKRRKKDFGRILAAGTDDEIIIAECGAEKAARWKSENDQHCYRSKQYINSGFSIFSYDALEENILDFDEERNLIDENVDVETEAIMNHMKDRMIKGMKMLDDEQKIILYRAFWLKESEAEISEKTRVCQSTVSNRKNRAMKILKTFVEDESIWCD